MGLTKPQIAEKACELIECLKMWDISKVDAIDITKAMKLRIENTLSWKNPLAGTGMKVAEPGEQTINNVSPIKQNGANVLSNTARARIFHEPQSEIEQ